jgi:hypothetical protein
MRWKNWAESGESGRSAGDMRNICDLFDRAPALGFIS